MDMIPPPEARILPTGEPMEGGASLFEGSSDDAREFLRGLTAEQRADVAIWTPGHVFTVAEFEAEIPHHEHDPLARDATAR